jgi:hypothetical protein
VAWSGFECGAGFKGLHGRVEEGRDHTSIDGEGLNKGFRSSGVEATRRLEGVMSTSVDWEEFSQGIQRLMSENLGW